MRRLRRCAVIVGLATVGLTGTAHAQVQTPCNVQATGLLITHFQTGQVFLPAFSGEMQQLIMAQTGGSRQYPALAQLGPVQNIQLLGAQQLPSGAVCGYAVQFQVTTLLLQVAWGYNNVIYGVNFSPTQPQQPGPGPQPSSPSGPTPTGPAPTTPNPVPSSTGEACRLYPNLC